jgi:hypothetical protein
VYAILSESYITPYGNDLITFFKSACTSNFSSILIVFCQFFTWIALGDADLRVSLTLVRKASVLEEEARQVRDNITNVMNPYT